MTPAAGGRLLVRAAVLLAMTAADLRAEAPRPVPAKPGMELPVAGNVDIIGFKGERTSMDRPGQSVAVSPDEPSRQDTRTHLNYESSFTPPETGRISAAGFAVPRARGQDSRMSEVWVDGELLQDPYTGLPLVDEMDLRAFGTLTYHFGVPGLELPSLGPFGALHYRPAPIREREIGAGTTVGRPYGAGGWAMVDHGAAERGGVRLYGRHHATDGAYPYRSDNGTPYNSDDDATVTRRNNDRRSWQAVPMADWRAGVHHLRLIGVGGDIDQGLAPLRTDAPGQARESTAARLLSLSDTVRLATPGGWTPARIQIAAAMNDDRRSLADPAREILVTSGSAALRARGRRGALTAAWATEAAQWSLTAQSARADVGTSTGGDTPRMSRRDASSLYGAGGWQPWSGASLETKLQFRRLHDRTSETAAGAADSGPVNSSTELAGQSLAVAQQWRPEAPLTVTTYAQAARTGRAPALIERFGDGGHIFPADGALEPEITRHREIGVKVTAPDRRWQAGLAGFSDQTVDRILLLPSLAQASRARNVGSTTVTGLETRLQWEGGPALLQSTATWLDARARSGSRDRRLPLVPERTVTTGIDWRIGDAVARWLGRHQTRTYRDLSNSIEIPGYWIHDLWLDLAPRHTGHRYAAGLGIMNLFDVRSLPVRAPETPGNSGQTPYADIEGHPLPGRQWRASLEVTL